jgi:hypothetical protein
LGIELREPYLLGKHFIMLAMAWDQNPPSFTSQVAGITGICTHDQHKNHFKKRLIRKKK